MPGLLVLRRSLPGLALVGLLAFIALAGFSLWNEWLVLRQAEARARLTAVVGYPGISPRYSFAQRPSNWFHDEGESTLIWGGWRPGSGHQWFRVGRGEIEPRLISSGLGRDTVQVIDTPLVERRGDLHWERVPDEASVAGHQLGGIDSAYPLIVLDKVIVVNDMIADHPYLVTFNSANAETEQVAIYEPLLDGRRVTMGMTGYFYNGHPLLFDRGSESLWIGDAEGLRAIAGTQKGRRLRRLARPLPTAWRHWRSHHPEGRLIVGADRSRPPPSL